MAGCLVFGLTSSLKWGKTMVTHEVIHDGRNSHCRSYNGGVKASSRFIRTLKYKYDEGSSRSNITRENRQGASDYGAHKLLQDGITLEEVATSLKDRVYQGTAVDSYEYSRVLQLCSKKKDFALVKQVHDCIKESQMEQHPYVVSNLLKCYIGCGKLQAAQEIFNKILAKDTVTWNIMIGGCADHDQAEVAIEMYIRMRNQGGRPDAVTYVSALKACASPTALKWGKDIHDHIRRDGLQANVRIGTALLLMYANCGNIEDARAVFGSLERRDVVSWNAMIGGLAQHGLGHEAFSLFLQMQREGFSPDAATYLSMLNPCSSTGALEWIEEVYAHATKAGLDTGLRVGTALVNMYAKSGSIEDARAIFDRMKIRDVASWNVIIGGLAEHGLGLEAVSFFRQMQRGIKPDGITYVSILHPSSSKGALEWVKEVHACAVKANLDVDVRVGNAIVHMYAKSGSIEDARAVFDRMERRDVISWNVMIGGLAERGLRQEAFSLFLQMQREGFTPDAFTYVIILHPCLSKGAMEFVKEVHSCATKAGLDVDVRVGSALVHMYAKIGLVANARQVFDKMRNRDVISWSVMIGALAQHGHGREAVALFGKMKTKGVKPNIAMLVEVLSGCSHSGLVDEGRSQFVSMWRDDDMEPTLAHYNCMVDLLGRAGHLEEAKVFILNMPIKPNVVTWTAFLGACRIFNNLELAELAAKECLKLEPADASPYVQLSNVYAAVGKWDQVSSIRSLMKERGIRKDGGRCWIEVNNKVHHFFAGDTSHPEAKEIYAMLNSLIEKLRDEGYTPDTRLVLQDMDEDDKENALCSHSEKLAIAYGLIHVTPGNPIRIYKNLRICADCHTATKLISKITGREIVARDANRFHHCKDGWCSCGDYW